MTTIIYKYQIPDTSKPIPKDRGLLGPSGELIDFIPEPINLTDIIGRVVGEFSPYVGTYGMGGPGFFGLRLGKEWLVIAVWGAAEWLKSKGRNVGDSFYGNYGRDKPLLADWLPGEESDELSKDLIGATIVSFDLQKDSLCIEFNNDLDITISKDFKTRPILEGNKKPRAFKPNDDLRKAVFLSPTTEIWV